MQLGALTAQPCLAKVLRSGRQTRALPSVQGGFVLAWGGGYFLVLTEMFPLSTRSFGAWRHTIATHAASRPCAGNRSASSLRLCMLVHWCSYRRHCCPADMQH